jgi:hypothetical protein
MAAAFCACLGGPQGTSRGPLKMGGNILIYREKISLQKAGFGLLLRRRIG